MSHSPHQLVRIISIGERLFFISFNNTIHVFFSSIRKYQLLYFLIDGNNVIDIKVSPLLILNFNLPPMDPNSFYADDVAVKLAALFNFDASKIRRVKIVPVGNQK